MLQGRICAELRESYRILSGENEHDARVSGRLRHLAQSRLDFPAVGDDVVFEHAPDTAAIIQQILPRRSAIIRKAAGTTSQEQIIAANVDHLLIVCGLDGDFNVRRIERYIALARSSGVDPVLVLNKADMCRDLDVKLLELADANVTAPIHVLSAVSGDGLETLHAYTGPSNTLALVGSSGAGKSTITNGLLRQQTQSTSAVRSGDDRGRHTTTSRQMFVLPSGAFLIDTPGMRELRLWADADALDDAFDDVTALATHCRFTDCAHDTEPGCAIRAALGESLDPARFENYQKLRREQAHMNFKRKQR